MLAPCHPARIAGFCGPMPACQALPYRRCVATPVDSLRSSFAAPPCWRKCSPPRRPRSCCARGGVMLDPPRVDSTLSQTHSAVGDNAGDTQSRRARSAAESAAFRDWLQDNGMYLSAQATWGRPMHALAIADETTDDGEPSGRGLVALKGVTQGESLFEVPVALVMTREKALEEMQGKLPADLDEYLALAVLLVRERAKGDRSFWKPYLDVLPKDEDLIPLFLWSEEELHAMEGSPSVAAAKSLRAKVRGEFHDIEERVFAKDRACFPEDVFSIGAWEWAFAILFSRAIMLQKEGCVALVPYADLINHNPFCSSYIDMQAEFLTGEKFVALYTDRPYSKMDQVFVTYGPKSNSELLLLYGFVVDRNPYDAVDVTVSLDPSDPLYEQKLEYTESSGVADGEATFPLYGDRYPMELIEFLRFCLATEAELESSDFGNFVSEKNESSVATALIDACTVALEGYPQSLEEDKALMDDRALYRMFDTKTRCAIRQRYGEKRILRRTISTIQRERAEPEFMFDGASSFA